MPFCQVLLYLAAERVDKWVELGDRHVVVPPDLGALSGYGTGMAESSATVYLGYCFTHHFSGKMGPVGDQVTPWILLLMATGALLA